MKYDRIKFSERVSVLDAVVEIDAFTVAIVAILWGATSESSCAIQFGKGD